MLLESFNMYLVLKQYFFSEKTSEILQRSCIEKWYQKTTSEVNLCVKSFSHTKKLNRRNSFSQFAKKKFAKSSTREESPALQCLSEVFLDMSQWGRTPVNGSLLKKKLLMYKRLFCSHQGKLVNEQILFFKDYLSRKLSLL